MRFSRWLSVPGGLMAGLLTMAVATAAEPTVMQPEVAEGGDPGQHCAAVVEPVRKGQEASKVTEIGCFASFPEAIAAATGGEVQLPGSATPESVDGTNVNTEAVRLIGIDYDSRSYRGRSFSWFASNAFGCLGGRFYRATYLGKSFDNKLTSTRGFGFCSRNDSFTGYFQNGFFGRCFPNCTYIGNFLNNTTSSKRWLP